jgi:putative transposase
MKGKRYSQEQKVYALKQVEAGTQVVEVCRQLGVSVATFYQWKRTLGSLGISELNELRVLRDENQRLKRLVADLTLDKHILQEVVAKKSKACPSPGDRAVDLRELRGNDIAVMQADPFAALGVLPQRPSEGLYAPSAAIAGAGWHAGEVRLSPPHGAAQKGGHQQLPQRRLPDLPRGESGSEKEEAAQTRRQHPNDS